jgi:8-oxo-dGTP pyrophosphatase MutT (NUDIX family)
MSEPEIRNAATVILVRDADASPRVLMGQRGAGAAFMPNRFVFPGGALDPEDAAVPLAQGFDEPCRARLREDAAADLTHALAAAAVRELWEETGLVLGSPGAWPGDVPDDWHGFAASGHLPSAEGLHFIFRAITPPGRPRRFDARFFLADAGRLASDPDDFTHASDELSHLQWIPLDEVRDFHMPFITEVVLAEVAAALPTLGPPATVPFFRNDDEESLFLRLGGSPLRP